MLALDATLIVRGGPGERRIRAADFFQGIFQTALSEEELLIAVEFPVRRTNSVHYFYEFARRHGDYAIAGLAAQAIVDAGTITSLRLAFFAVGDRPVLARAAGRLINVSITPALLSDASAALGEEIDASEDQQATAAMRRHLARVLLVRCISVLLGRPELRASGRAA
jgi:carbon-monoxide dehydrogenase medium subunit